MGLFARKPEAAPVAAAPARRARNSVTNAELDAAISTVCAEMADCTARQTLESLLYARCDGSANDIARFDGPAPVTLTQLDDALAEAEKFELPPGTLAPLTRVRALFAQVEANAAKVCSEPVTRAEFEAAQAADALALVIISDMLHDQRAGPLGLRLEAALQSVEFKSASAGIQALLGRLENARDADGARQRRRASGRLTVAAGGRNF